MTNPSEDKTTAPLRPQRVDRMARLETVPRLNEEKRTLEAMVASFCHAHHGTKKGEQSLLVLLLFSVFPSVTSR